MKGDRLRPLDLHDDGTFQHIDKCVRVVAMELGRSQRKTYLRGSSRMINARKYCQALCHDLRLEPIYRLLQSKAARYPN